MLPARKNPCSKEMHQTSQVERTCSLSMSSSTWQVFPLYVNFIMGSMEPTSYSLLGSGPELAWGFWQVKPCWKLSSLIFEVGVLGVEWVVN